MKNAYFFSTSQLAKLFSVNVSTVKRWADRGYLEFFKTAGGHRRISRQQLNQFIKKHPQQANQSYALRKLFNKNRVIYTENSWKKYYQLLKNDRTNEAAKLIEKFYLANGDILKTLKSLITPTLRYMSEQWSKEKISVYEEHKISFYIRSHLIKLDQYIPDRSNSKSPRAILACAPGEFHELPLQLLSLIFKMQTWKPYALGINIKATELIQAAKKIKPQIIIISKTYTKKESADYFNKVGRFTDQHGICLAMGGGTWKKYQNKKFIRRRKCAKYFPALKLFSKFITNYKRK